VFKNPTIDFNAFFNSLDNSTCSKVRLGFLALWGQHYSYCERPIRPLCLLFLCRLRFLFIPTDKNRICRRQLQTAVSSHPLNDSAHIFAFSSAPERETAPSNVLARHTESNYCLWEIIFWTKWAHLHFFGTMYVMENRKMPYINWREIEQVPQNIRAGWLFEVKR